MNTEDIKIIDEKRKELEKKYPIEFAYSSRASLWGNGLRDGIVDKELYNKARKYYERLWYYTGDWYVKMGAKLLLSFIWQISTNTYPIMRGN